MIKLIYVFKNSNPMNKIIFLINEKYFEYLFFNHKLLKIFFNYIVFCIKVKGKTASRYITGNNEIFCL